MTETQAERDRRLSREAKARRTGTCRVCGAETRYAGKPGKPVAELCVEHAAAERGLRTRGSGEVQQRALRYLTKPRRYSEIAERFGTATPMLLTRLMKHGLIRRVSRGVYIRTGSDD